MFGLQSVPLLPIVCSCVLRSHHNQWRALANVLSTKKNVVATWPKGCPEQRGSSGDTHGLLVPTVTSLEETELLRTVHWTEGRGRNMRWIED